MAVTTFADRFGNIAQQMAAANSSTASKLDKPKAKFWLNVGYEQPNDPKYPFVSLNNGIAIDTMERHELKGNNQEYLTLLKKQNDFADLIQAAAEQLEPGQTEIISRCEVSGICLQLRRVGDAQEFVPEQPTTPPVNLRGFKQAA